MGHRWAAGRRGAKEGLEILKAVNLKQKRRGIVWQNYVGTLC
jgi:hypothetical protein